MTLSPTALEEAAKAMKEQRRAQIEGRRDWATYDEQATAAITAYLAQAEKEGWMMVPAIPTPAMIDAGTRETEPSPQSDSWYSPIDLSDNQAEQCYRAMLAAAQNGGE